MTHFLRRLLRSRAQNITKNGGRPLDVPHLTSLGRFIYPKDQTITLGPEGSYAFFCLNTDIIPKTMAGLLQIGDETVTVNGQEFPREGHTFVLSGAEEEIAGQFLKVISDDTESLPRIGQLMPHYGKYSYLVFKGTKNIAKGQWPAKDSPLKIEL